MKSFTNLRNLYGTFTKNTATANLSHGDELMNDHQRTLCAKADFQFLHKTRTLTTVADTQFLNLPYDIYKVESVYVTVSSTRYVPKIKHSKEEWDMLNLTSYTSDVPLYASVYGGQLGLWPTPATAGNTITINGKLKIRDLNIADITTSTITTLANASTALTVSAGLTVQMAGFYIRPTFATTANTGDGLWYEIDSVTNATTATLVRKYGGTAIAAGTAACTISQMPVLPEDYHTMLPLYAASTYWYNEGDSVRGDNFKNMHDEKLKTFLSQALSSTTDYVLEEGDERQIINPNLTINL